jgi:hypothetical protein
VELRRQPDVAPVWPQAALTVYWTLMLGAECAVDLGRQVVGVTGFEPVASAV